MKLNMQMKYLILSLLSLITLQSNAGELYSMYSCENEFPNTMNECKKVCEQQTAGEKRYVSKKITINESKSLVKVDMYINNKSINSPQFLKNCVVFDKNNFECIDDNNDRKFSYIMNNGYYFEKTYWKHIQTVNYECGHK